MRFQSLINFNKNSWSLNYEYEYFKIEINGDEFENKELELTELFRARDAS